MVTLAFQHPFGDRYVRGLTPEPFGAGRTLLERQPAGSWRFIPAW